jgi:alpha-glucosidase
MKKRATRTSLITLAALWFGSAVSAQSSYDLRSPDNRIEVRIRRAQSIRYDVLLKGQTLLENCTLSLDLDHKVLGRDAKVLRFKERNVNNVLEPAVRQKFAKIHENFNELRLEMDGGYAAVFRAYNEGAAYRLETRLPEKQVKI